jgi:hypothetical protein
VSLEKAPSNISGSTIKRKDKMPKSTMKKRVKLPKKKSPPPPREEEDEGVVVESGVCPECREPEGLVDYTPILVQLAGVRVLTPLRHTRMCLGCWSGTKDRACDDCGEIYNPRHDDTFYVCGACYDRRHRDEEDDPE